jgi:hypothetical protein
LSHRLSPDDLERLERGFAHYENWPGLDEGTAAAALLYRRGLNRAGDFVQAVDDMKLSSPLRTMLDLAARPDLWPLVVRYGGEAAVKRIRRRFLRA